MANVYFCSELFHSGTVKRIEIVTKTSKLQFFLLLKCLVKINPCFYWLKGVISVQVRFLHWVINTPGIPYNWFPPHPAL